MALAVGTVARQAPPLLQLSSRDLTLTGISSYSSMDWDRQPFVNTIRSHRCIICTLPASSLKITLINALSAQAIPGDLVEVKFSHDWTNKTFVMETKNILAKEKHVAYFKRHLYFIPPCLFVLDSTRLSIAFFSICGLEVLGSLSSVNEEDKKSMCDWIYGLQIHPDEDGDCRRCGFLGTDTFVTLDNGQAVNCNETYANSHLAMTYTGLASLITLGDDLSRVNRAAVIKGVAALQQEDGSFAATLMGSENDMRFVYCACCICYILQDWSGMDMDKTLSYIRGSFSYDYGFGQGPDLESHGGVTYCAVASLVLMDKLQVTLSKKEIEGLRRWAVLRQVSGFQGRANKQEDTCYSFWVGATLKMLNFYDKVNFEENRKYILSTQSADIGGFSKVRDTIPDPLHSYLGLCGLSFMSEPGLEDIHPALNISVKAADLLHKIHQSW